MSTEQRPVHESAFREASLRKQGAPRAPFVTTAPRPAGGVYWVAVGLIVACTGAIVPLYLRESITRARLDALEKFTDTIGGRAGGFRPRSEAPSRIAPKSWREPERSESAFGAFARSAF